MPFWKAGKNDDQVLEELKETQKQNADEFVKEQAYSQKVKKPSLTVDNDFTPVEYDPQYILQVNHLKKYFPIKGGMVSKTVGYVKAVDGVTFNLKRGTTMGLVGESGCGKSTISALLMGRNKGYTGSMTVGGAELRNIEKASLMRRITYVSHQSYLFKGTVRDNLLMGKPGASDDELWSALTQVNLADFLRGEAGLDTLLSERGENLSGGQRQRLALARALLHDSPVYIFDEATSNIDVESENDIMAQIHALAGRKTVLLISHRLANVTASDEIYVLERGNIVQHGTHEALLKQGGAYTALWSAQQVLEHYGEEAAK